ncbi:exodeoxyribonuclease VII small subunit [Salinicola endophyticus]|uniref:Exodeoxyribonuclease 7 small subunit n=1 Tax=Salinicola endophyticus TaxID=1949083 RepID=A0ABY8FDZ8_9GAMM|nr:MULTISPECIES: exodeoxyribonuclease VII small subunit [Salinicola]WFF41044.1 exodeoxyribonuclease VII small subunit [Salinicola endophyticus]
MSDKMAEQDVPQDFATTLTQLERLVAQLESGELTLEASLAAFERGIRLTRDAQSRLDGAELKVQALLEQADGTLQSVPFETTGEPPHAP